MKGGQWFAPGELYEIEQMRKQHADLLAACENLLEAIEDLIGDDEFDYLGECMREARAVIAEVQKGQQ